MKKKYKYPVKMYQGDLLDPVIPAWVEIASLVAMGVVMGGLFAYGLLTVTGG